MTAAGFIRAKALAFFAALVVPCSLSAAPSPDAAEQTSFRIAVAQTPAGTSLDDLLSGRARLGFTPVVDEGIVLVGQRGESIWLRLRGKLPESQGGDSYFISLPRQQIDQLRLVEAGPPELELASTGIGDTVTRQRWSELLLLPIPAGSGADGAVYLEVQGQGYLNLQPRLLSATQLRQRAVAGTRVSDLLYLGLLAVAALSVLRRMQSGERTLRVGLAALGCLVASMVGNQHLQLSVGGTSLSAMPNLPPALWLMACATLLWATQQYTGHEKTNPPLGRAVDRAGLGVLILGALALFVPIQYLPQLQLAALAVLGLTALASAAALLLDRRQARWPAVLLWLGFLPVLLLLPLSMLQLVPASGLVSHGFQLLLLAVLAVYLLAPWARSLLHRRPRGKRGGVPEPSTEQKIAHAREWMISSLQAGIENAADSDMEWIAYRRLMGGLKTVLPQTGAAVIAMNYHNEDLLLVEPRSAEPRFQMLLAQRASLLKNLSRSLAPQQIGVDFTGPEGPLQQVLLAIIPLPIERPGWGVLVIERSAQVSYSEDELDLCTEFAALATTAGDEAAAVMQLRQANEIDSESGVYKAAMLEPVLRRAHEAAMAKRKPLSMLRVSLDGHGTLQLENASALLRRLVDVVREEIDYGETILRFSDDQFIVLLSGRPVGEARALGERICATVRKQAAEHAGFATSLGVAQMQPMERSPQQMLERSAKALAKARQYGGNQVQAIATV